MEHYLVYYINLHINPTSYHHLFRSQMKDLIECDFLNHGQLYIEASMPMFRQREMSRHIQDVFPISLRGKVILSCHEDNSHEFRGLDRVWRLAREHPSSTAMIGYFHSKGISSTRYSHQNNRDPLGAKLFDRVIRPWKEVEIVLNTMPHINKIGAAFSAAGFMWFNFWWARGSYLSHVEKPILTDRRHYYEDWLGRKVRERKEECQRSDREEYSLGDPMYYDLSDKDCYNIANRDHQIADTPDSILW